MKAEYTVKIGDVFYKAGQELPEIDSEVKAVTTEKVEPPVIEEPVVEESPVVEEPKEQKRQYRRRKQ